MKQLKRIWEQSILLGLGRDRNINAKRLMFLFDDGMCVYPAQSLQGFEDSIESLKA